MVALSLTMTELITAAMAWLLLGVVTVDYLLTGMVASVLVASFVVALVLRSAEQTRRLAVHAAENEERYRIVSGLSSDLIFACRRQAESDLFHIDWLAGSCEDLFGASAEKVKSLGCWRSFVLPEDLPIFDRTVTALAPGQSGECELRLRHADGTQRHVHVHARALPQVLGETDYRLYGSCHDITGRRQIEDALRENTAKLRGLYELSPLGIALTDMKGRYVEFNEAFLRICGYAADELKAIDYWTLTPRKYEADELRQLEALERTGYYGPYEKEYIRKDGSLVSLQLNGMLIAGNDGQKYIWSIVEDITDRKRVSEALRKSEERLSEAQRIAQIGSWELDLGTNVLTWSDEIFRIFEIDPKAFGASYEGFLAAVHPEDRDRVNQAYTNSLNSRRPYEITHRLLMADGGVKYVHEHCETAYDADGKPLRSVGTVQDVTMRVLNEESLRQSEERFRTIADYTYDWEYWLGPQGELLYISPSCKRVTGYAQADFISDPGLIYAIVHAEDRSLLDAYRQDIRRENDGALDFRIVTQEGEVRWIAYGCRAVYARDGQFMGRRASNRDITDRKGVEAQVQQLAYFDTLTGLPNRRMLADRLAHALSHAARYQRSLAIMFLDLDNFKKINDTLGHDVGDELLKGVATRLTTCVRSGDTVARQGGDEFIIVLAEIADPEDAAFVATKIIKTLGDPVRVADRDLDVTPSIGIAVYPVNSGDDANELMKKADKAMYAAKAAGGNAYRFFDD